ncbi:hypothetical protein GQ53DRAFT_176961 [Thozetella sp. PMI_491]|nr:hypothetical protein GQ53DRAFT_176961 [Thozetella sp. PMI_491]
MADTAAENAFHFIHMQGLALGIFASSVVFAVMTTVIIVLRVWIRIRTQCFGIDDLLMCIGWLMNFGQYAIAIWGAIVGVGTPDDRLNPENTREALKAILFWQASYACTLAFIKSSICVALTRITQEKLYLNILRGLIILSVAMSTVGLLVIFNQCHPIQDYWDQNTANCWPAIIPTALSYAASVANVITDVTVASIPYFILRKVQMRSRLKLYVNMILGLGILAGVASIIRVPYTNAYMETDDIVYHIGNIVLWTIVECGIGITAGSLPSLRMFFKHLASDKSSNDYKNSDGTNLVTIGQVKGRRNPVYDTEIGVTVVAQGNDDDSNHEEDGDSTRHIIKVTKELEQITEMADDRHKSSSEDGPSNGHISRHPSM